MDTHTHTQTDKISSKDFTSPTKQPQNSPLYLERQIGSGGLRQRSPPAALERGDVLHTAGEGQVELQLLQLLHLQHGCRGKLRQMHRVVQLHFPERSALNPKKGTAELVKPATVGSIQSIKPAINAFIVCHSCTKPVAQTKCTHFLAVLDAVFGCGNSDASNARTLQLTVP